MGQYTPLNDEDGGMLNNFFCHFCFDKKHLMPDGFYRTISAKHWNTTFRDYMKGQIDHFVDKLEGYFSSRSDKILDQTPAEFYAEVDRATIEVGCDATVIAEMICDFKDKSNTREQAIDKYTLLDSYIRPIYMALRKEGYNKVDLWS